MQAQRLFRYAASLCIATALLAGCVGSQPPIGAPGSMPRASAIAQHAAPGKSWMLPEASGTDLLYVSDPVDKQVDVLSYPQGTLQGTLTGFTSPLGLCSDSAANVWIVNESPAEVIEYGHGGTSPIATLDIPFQAPLGCAIDPKTGNLAVSGVGAEVSVFQEARGQPTTYGSDDFYHMYFCGYDNHDNLFISGDSQSGANIAELPANGNNLRSISLSETLARPGAVQWDGKHVTLANLIGGSKLPIYRLSFTGSTAHIASTTMLKVKHLHGGQGWIQGQTYVQPEGSNNRMIGFWKYPHGGRAKSVISLENKSRELFGITVSVAPSH